jgi:hypothetical protein
MSLASRKLIQATAGATTVDTGDDDFANVVLLLDGDGTSGDANNTFTDSSSNGFTITESGSVVQGSFSPYGDNWSNYFDGSGDILNFTPSFSLGSNDFTIEMWIKPEGSAVDASALDTFFWLESGTSDFIAIRIDNSGNEGLEFRVYKSGTQVLLSQGSDYTNANEWVHVAATKNGSTYNFFVNGTSVGTATYATSLTSYTGGHIGGWSSVSQDYIGYVSNVRIVNGTALYTSNFTPSTTPLTAVTNTVLLTCKSNSFVDSASSPHTLTLSGTPKVTPFSPFKDDDARDITTDGGSGYFNGAKLDVGSASDFAFGTGDFTVDAWVYLNSNVNTSIFNIGPASTGSFGFYYVASTNKFELNRYGDPAGSGRSDVHNPVGQWFHVRGIRSGGTSKLFINGVENTSASYSMGSVTATNLAEVGGGILGLSNTTNAYIADLRVEVGTATSTSNFTPPTSPVSTTANTDLLLNFQDAGIYDRSGINNLDTVGDARLGFAPIYGTGSLAFDGTGDYLGIENTPELRFSSSSPFTIELWVNANALSGDQHFFWAYDPSSPYTGWALAFGANSQAATTLMWWDGTSWTNIKTGMEANRWYHIAVCSEGSSSTGRFFVDGVQQGSAYTIPSTILNTTTNIRLGSQNNAYYFNGYFDDVRITNGVARYTSDFTPPDEIDLSTDTHREYVTFFLDGDGTVNGQNNTFTDSSTNDFTVTESGSVVQGVFSPYGDNWSNYFDGSTALQKTSGVTTIGTGDFTVEFWFCPNNVSSGYRTFYDGREASPYGDGVGIFQNGTSIEVWGNGQKINQTGVVTASQWTHLALVRSSGSIQLYINGSASGSSVSLTDNFTSDKRTFGENTVGSGYTFQGYISNLRETRSAVYTSGFTPSTTPLSNITNTNILMLQSNRTVDNSSNNYDFSIIGTSTPKISRFSPFESDKPYDITTDGGSAYFDGTSHYLNATGNSSTQMGTGAFTWECWCYITATASYQCLIDTRPSPSSGSSTGMALLLNTGTYTPIAATTTTILTSSIAVKPNSWNHVALTRSSGGTLTIWVNGQSGGTTSNSSNLTDTALWVGGNSSSPYPAPVNGYITDSRITKGADLYTASFSLPSAPLTTTVSSGTVGYLLNFQDSAIPDLSGLNNIDTVGNAKVGGTDPTKYGSNAMAFDGTGDYLSMPDDDTFNFGSGDWTVECWFNRTGGGTRVAQVVFNQSVTGASSDSALFLGAGNNGLSLYLSTSGTSWTNFIETSTAPSLNAWSHCVWQRRGNTLEIYLDGTLQTVVSGSSSFSGTIFNSSKNIEIGTQSSSAYLTGYLDDLRVTKGVARYTANFTPPTDALPKF